MVYYTDSDGDSFGGGNGEDFCNDPGVGYTLNNEDCNDDNDQINPTFVEGVCDLDGIDNDCNGFTDENYDEFLCNGGGGGNTDNDADGYDEFSDCNDSNPNINPGATEIPNNNIDEDCDGQDLINGIIENSKISLQIFPNPGTSNFFISSENLEKGENLLKIIDINGRIVFENKFDITGVFYAEIQTNDFTKGVYQIVLSSGKQISRANWIKL